MRLKRQTLFKVFDLESRMRTSISYHFASVHCNTLATTMNYINRACYQAPNPSDTYLVNKFKTFDLFRTTQYNKKTGAVIRESFIDSLKREKPYIGQYTDPIKQLVLSKFHFSLAESPVFEQAVYVLKEVRNQCAHLELITRFRLKRTRKLNFYNDITNYAHLSRMDINYMDVLKILKIFGRI